MYDVVIVGGGVVGGMIARNLSKYRISCCILEKENDVAMGATKANSAIVHAGFDAAEGSLKAKLNVRGSEMFEQIAGELGVKYKNNGSLVVGFDDDDRETVNELYERGCKNGVKNLKVLSGDEARAIEPNLSENVTCALHAPTGAIVCPYELTIAAVGNAMDNGCDLKLNYEVSGIVKKDGIYEIHSGSDVVEARYIVNAAGAYADRIAEMAGDTSFKLHPRRGEYILLDKECGNIITHTVFRTPSKMGKGILVSPTVDGNLLTGPTSVDIDDRDDKKTTNDGFYLVMKEASENVNGIDFRKSITSFCGLRAVGDTGDFIINSPFEGFVNVAGIESPGLSASPAIAEMVADMLKDAGLELSEKEDFNPLRKPMHAFRDAGIQEKNEIIKKDSAFGKIVCRCETVSEGEILEAIRTNPRPSDVDGVKRRTRANMGRCQGGFCTPYIMELLANELGIPVESITKSGGESIMLTGRTKEV